MRSLRRLPRQGPRRAAAGSARASAPTQALVQQDPGRHRDVEGLRPLRQRNRDAPRGHGVQVRPDPGPLVAHDHADRPGLRAPPFPRPFAPARERAVQRCTVRRRRPQGEPSLARPRDERAIVERDDGVAKRGAHRGTERLGAEHVGAAAQHDGARGTKGVRRADQRANVTRVLHAVDDERHAPVPDRELIGGPLAGLDDREDPLGRLRVGELLERARRDLLYRDRAALELGTEGAAPRRAVELGRDQGAAELEPGAERLLDEPHTLHDGEAATAARLAPLEIAQHRLQITGYENSLPPAAAGLSKRRRPLRVCQAQGRSVRIALTIAGSDSGGGAGIQADLKTFHQFGVFGTSVITAVTAQNTLGVRAWEPVPVQLVTRQLDALADDLPPVAVKSGMLGSAPLVEAVADGIARRRLPNYVLDPVMVATSGDRLLDRDAERLIVRRLVPLAALVTPNLDEAAVLVGGRVRTPHH